MPETIRLESPAKVNYYLRVTGRRPDGFHDLVNVMCRVSLFDEIEVRIGGQGVWVECDHPEVPSDNNHAERQIRPAVIVRKNSYTHSSEEGTETEAVLMSVFRTLKQRGHNPVSATLDALRVYLKTGQLPPLPERITENG